MSKSITTWLISLMLVIYGGYNIWATYLTGNFWFLLWTFLCFTGAIGLVLSKPWSQHYVYVVSFITVAGWLYVTISIALQGWPYQGITQTIMSLVPGILLSVACVLSSAYVFRKFKNVANKK